MNRGKLIVLTAPLTESIDHAGYFIQMSMASLPMWLEGHPQQEIPEVARRRTEPGRLGALHAGGPARPRSRAAARATAPTTSSPATPTTSTSSSARTPAIVAVSTHNPLGVTFAAGVYTSIFGSAKQPINSHYSRELFARVKASPFRGNFKVIVGGSGGWQIAQTDSWDELSVDCVVEGRSESTATMDLFARAIRGEALPRQIDVGHPRDRDGILIPDKRTTFGVVEMTTGCGRRCQFCLPDLNPQLDVPKNRMMAAVHANVRDGNNQISLATEDMFIWGQVHTDTPFYFPNREALLDLYSEVVNTPGVEHHVLSHATIAPAVVDPVLIKKLSDVCLDKSPIKLPLLSTHPEKRALVPLIGLETGSVRMAKQIMPSKGVPFSIDDWPSVVVRGLEVLNANNWFPVDDADRRQPRRDRRGCQGHDRPDLRGRAPRALRVLHSVDLHAPPRHAHGAEERRDRDQTAHAAAVAADDEVLEDEPAARSNELVGTDGLAARAPSGCGRTSCASSTARLHVADADVRERGARNGPLQAGQDSHRAAARDQDA